MTLSPLPSELLEFISFIYAVCYATEGAAHSGCRCCCCHCSSISSPYTAFIAADSKAQKDRLELLTIKNLWGAAANRSGVQTPHYAAAKSGQAPAASSRTKMLLHHEEGCCSKEAAAAVSPLLLRLLLLLVRGSRTRSIRSNRWQQRRQKET